MAPFLFGSSNKEENAPSEDLAEAMNHPKMTTSIELDLLSGCDPKTQPLIGAIDQGTSSTRFLVFFQGKIVASAQMEHTQIFPPGEDKVREVASQCVF
jgi:hypothetical protein